MGEACRVQGEQGLRGLVENARGAARVLAEAVGVEHVVECGRRRPGGDQPHLARLGDEVDRAEQSGQPELRGGEHRGGQALARSLGREQGAVDAQRPAHGFAGPGREQGVPGAVARVPGPVGQGPAGHRGGCRRHVGPFGVQHGGASRDAVRGPFAAGGSLVRVTSQVPRHGWFEKSASNVTAYRVLPDRGCVCEP